MFCFLFHVSLLSYELSASCDRLWSHEMLVNYLPVSFGEICNTPASSLHGAIKIFLNTTVVYNPVLYIFIEKMVTNHNFMT